MDLFLKAIPMPSEAYNKFLIFQLLTKPTDQLKLSDMTNMSAELTHITK